MRHVFRARLGAFLVILFAAPLTGCFTIEHHIFLNADGTGRFLWYLSVASPKTPGEAPKTNDDAKETLANLKAEVMKLKGHGIKDVAVEEIDRRDLAQLRVAMSFATLEGLAKAMTALDVPDKNDKKVEKTAGKKADEKGEEIRWTAKLTSQGGKTKMTAAYTLKVDLAEEGKEQDQMTKEIGAIILAMASVHFTVHAPAPIQSHNADFAEGQQASWRAALSSFTSGAPLEMELTY